MKVFIIMVLLHLINDFVFKPQILTNLTCKSWWEKNAPQKMYESDYITALFLQGLLWSSLVHLPIILTEIVPMVWLTLSILINAIINALICNLVVNRKEMNLFLSQITFINQILIIWLIFVL